MAFSLSSLLANAEPLKVGDKAPSASALSDSGTRVDLSEVYSKHPYTLVYFFPKADTPGCTKQGCSLRDSYAKLADLGVEVIGVSADSVEAQKAFKEKYHFPFTLLADADKKVISAFGVPTIPVVGFARRQAYLVKGGVIVYADHKGSTDKQADDILAFLKGS